MGYSSITTPFGPALDIGPLLVPVIFAILLGIALTLALLLVVRGLVRLPRAGNKHDDETADEAPAEPDTEQADIEPIPTTPTTA